MSKIICYREDCKHICSPTNECVREVTLIDESGVCRNYHKSCKDNSEQLVSPI